MPLNQDVFEIAAEQVNLAISEMLASDPANQIYLQNLEDIKVQIECTLPAMVFLITCHNGNIRLHKVVDSGDEQNQQSPSDLQLSGTAINLIKLATSPIDNASALRGANVSVSGDVGLLLELSQVAKMIDIDWEFLLAEKIGETPAVIISRTLSTGLREARKFQDQLLLKLTEKMQAEDSPLPGKSELNDLKKQLRDLNYRLDRLEAATAEQQS